MVSLRLVAAIEIGPARVASSTGATKVVRNSAQTLYVA
jgi:hypothetical protein